MPATYFEIIYLSTKLQTTGCIKIKCPTRKLQFLRNAWIFLHQICSFVWHEADVHNGTWPSPWHSRRSGQSCRSHQEPLLYAEASRNKCPKSNETIEQLSTKRLQGGRWSGWRLSCCSKSTADQTSWPLEDDFRRKGISGHRLFLLAPSTTKQEAHHRAFLFHLGVIPVTVVAIDAVT